MQVILKQASDIIYNFIVKDKILDTLLIKKQLNSIFKPNPFL
jgi:hypothetical protein